MSDIRDIVRARLRDYDPTIDVSAGSPADTIVVIPIAEALSSDVLTADTAEFIRAKLVEAFPDITLGTGDALTDILVNASSVMLEPYRAEIARVARSLSLADISTLADDDVDALAANWMVSRITGAFARLTVQVTLNNPRLLRINSVVRFVSRGGLVFTPTSSYTLSATQVASYLSANGDYVVPVQCIATERGSEYNISIGQIIAVENLTAAVSVTNTSPGVGGLDRESNASLAARIPQSISERSLVTERGIRAKVLSEEPTVDGVAIVGRGDVEMVRDQLSASLQGFTRGSGFAVAFYNMCVVCLYRGEPVVGDTLHLNPVSGGDVVSVSVKSVTRADDALQNATSYLLEVSDTGSGPTGVWACVVEAPAVAYLGGEEITTNVGIGGKADIYVTPSDDTASSSDVEVDYTGGDIGVGVRVFSVEDGYKSVLTVYTDPSNGTVDLSMFTGERAYQYVVVESGRYKGAYEVLGVVQDIAQNKLGVIVDYAFTEASIDLTARWRGCDRIEIALNSPFSVIYPYGDEQLSVRIRPDRSSLQASVDVSAYARQGDTLSIPELSSEFTISSVAGDVIHITDALQSSGVYVAEIRRVRPAIGQASPFIREVSSGTSVVPYGYSLGAEVKSASSPITLNQGGLGRVATNLHSLFSNDNRVLTLSLSSSGYSIPIGGADVSDRAWTNPSGAQLSSAFVVRVVWDLAQNGSDDADAFEIALPTDLIVQNRNSTVVCFGDLDVDYLIARIQEAYSFGDPISSIADVVTTSRQSVIDGNRGDLITVGGQSALIERVHQVHISTSGYSDAGGVRSVSSQGTLNISLVTTKTNLVRTHSSSVQFGMRFTESATGSLPSIDLLDFIRMLCRPEQLVASNYMASAVQTALSDSALPALPAGEIQMSALSDALVSCTRPSRGVMSLYYASPRTVTVEEPLLAQVPHGTSVSGLSGVDINMYDNQPLYAEGLYLDATSAADLDYVRDATIRADVELSGEARVYAANSVPEGEEAHTHGVDLITVPAPAASYATPRQDTRVALLHESLTVTSRPPRIDQSTLSIVEIAGGTSVQDVIDNEIYLNWLIDSDGDAVDASIVPQLRNSYGDSVLQVLSALDPSLEIALDVNLDNPPASYVFYNLTHIEDGCGLLAFTAEPLSKTLTQVQLYQNHSPSAPQSVSGDRIWVDDVGSGYITSVSGASLLTDVEQPRGTSPAAVFGWVYISVAEPTKLILEGPRVKYRDANGDDVFTDPLIKDNACGLYIGGTSGLLSTRHTGKSIDLINAAWDPRIRLDEFASLGIPLPDGFPIAGEASIYAAHLGSHVIASIEEFSEYDLLLDIDVVYRQEITLSVALDLSALGPASTVETYIPTFFRISDDSIPAPDVGMKTCVTAKVYHHEPTHYTVRSIPMDYGISNQSIEIHTLDGDIPSKVDSGVFHVDTYGDYSIPIRDTRLTPYAFYRPGVRELSTSPYYGGLHKVDVGFVYGEPGTPIEGATYEVTRGGEDDGFFETHGESTYTASEEYGLSLPPLLSVDSARVDITSTDLSVDYEVSPTVTSLSDKYNSPRHRAVCSDLLVRRSLPCYIGVYLRYRGGSDADVVTNDIKQLVSGALLRGDDLSGADIVSAAHRRGARSVAESAVYLVMSDATRRRRVFLLRDGLTASLSGTYVGTPRITGVQMSDSEKLGVTLDIERL